MVIHSGLLASCPGLVYPFRPKLPFQPQRSNRMRFNDFTALQQISGGGIQCSPVKKDSVSKCASSVGRDYHQTRFDDDISEEPFWLSLIKEIVWGLKSLFMFLVEQPSQLKYIEWPGFQSTLKTATLTLVLVAMLIVALSSVDSALSFLLAVILRRKP